MTGNKAFVASAITVVVVVLGATSVARAAMEESDKSNQGGSVIPCNLDGVNPAYHPEIFGNPTVARSYGFVQGPDRVWRVDSNCRKH